MKSPAEKSPKNSWDGSHQSYACWRRSRWNTASSFGSFIFGLSGVQTNLPAGWGGGNLLAIHGTNNPASIGLASSAGCLRVSRATLERLEAVLVLGAPVIVKR